MWLNEQRRSITQRNNLQRGIRRNWLYTYTNYQNSRLLDRNKKIKSWLVLYLQKSYITNFAKYSQSLQIYFLSLYIVQYLAFHQCMIYRRHSRSSRFWCTHRRCMRAAICTKLRRAIIIIALNARKQLPCNTNCVFRCGHPSVTIHSCFIMPAEW